MNKELENLDQLTGEESEKIVSYNHDLEALDKALGVDSEKTRAIYEKIIDEENTNELKKKSRLAEEFEKSLTKRELAYILAATH